MSPAEERRLHDEVFDPNKSDLEYFLERKKHFQEKQEREAFGRYPYKAFVWGDLCVTTTTQAQGAPFMDPCTTHDKDGNCYCGYAFLLKPWRQNQFGESLPQPALVIAWRHRLREGSHDGVAMADASLSEGTSQNPPEKPLQSQAAGR